MIAVVDLDGTYLRANSLHIYIRLGIKHLLRHGRWLRAARLTAVLAARMLRAVSHAHMKFKCAGLIGWNKELETAMTCECARHVNPDVLALVTRWEAEGCDIVIATAAFLFYAKCIVPHHVIGTTFQGNNIQTECRGENKADRVVEFAKLRSSDLHAIVTDSFEDLPLLKLPFSQKYFISGDAHKLETLARSGISAVLIIPTSD